MTPAIPVAEAAKRLGVTVQRVHQLINEGGVRARQRPGSVAWYVELEPDGSVWRAPKRRPGRPAKHPLAAARARGVSEEQIREALDALRGEGVGPSTF